MQLVQLSIYLCTLFSYNLPLRPSFICPANPSYAHTKNIYNKLERLLSNLLYYHSPSSLFNLKTNNPLATIASC